MSKDSSQSLFYKDKPLFGIDIGFNSIKVMQIANSGDHSYVQAYGVVGFDDKAIKDGVIEDYKIIATAIKELFSTRLNGTIDTKRVAATIPSSKAYSRVINQSANLTKKELYEAVMLEAAQYIPIPLEELYIDYSVVGKRGEDIDILVVGVPKKITDSYMNLFELLGLELCLLETTTSASSRIISKLENSSNTPTILIDLGSLSVDLTVFDNNLVVNGTIPGGGDDFTNKIADRLQVSKHEADHIKTKYGLGVSRHQADIREALKPQLDSLAKEVRRVVRYYEEKTDGKATIGQIITMGGGSNMPGLVDYLTDTLRIPTRLCNFWTKFDTGSINPPSVSEKSLYVTVAGAAVIKPEEITA